MKAKKNQEKNKFMLKLKRKICSRMQITKKKNRINHLIKMNHLTKKNTVKSFKKKSIERSNWITSKWKKIEIILLLTEIINFPKLLNELERSPSTEIFSISNLRSFR